MTRIKDLTPQEQAVFGHFDNPLANVTGMAEALAERVSKQTKGKIRAILDKSVEPLLWDLSQSFKTVAHDENHAGQSPDVRLECMACRIELAIEAFHEVTL